MRACAWWVALVLAVAGARELDPAACSARFDVQRDKIIRTEESREMGARYLAELDVGSRAECLRLCCETDACDVFVFEEKSPGSCYLFACGPPEDFRCKFTAHGNFSSGVLALGRRLAERQDRQRHEQQLARLRNPSTTSWPTGTTGTSPRPPAPPATPAGLPQQHALPTQPLQPSPPRRCSRYQFECRRGGECIAVYNACDGVPQCADHSDEAPELGCPAPAAPLAPVAPAAPVAPPELAVPPAPHPQHVQVVPAMTRAAGAGGAGGTGGAGGAGGAMGATDPGGAGQPDSADAGELWPWRLTQAQRRYPGVPGPGGAGGAAGSAPHIFSHQGGLLQTGALAPNWPRRAWPLGPPSDTSHNAIDSMEGDGEREGGERRRTRPEERPGAWPEESAGAWPEERRAWPVPARLDPEAAVYAPERTMPELPLYAAAGPQRPAAPHDAPKKGLELSAPAPRAPPAAAPPPAPPRAPPDRTEHQPQLHDKDAEKKSLKQTVALERHARPGAGSALAGAEARDGPSERPPAAVLLLVLGTLMTAALGALLACRARAARSRRRAHPRLALDADYLVNGMYL